VWVGVRVRVRVSERVCVYLCVCHSPGCFVAIGSESRISGT